MAVKYNVTWEAYSLLSSYRLSQSLPNSDKFRQDLVKLLIDRIHDTFAPYNDDARRVHLVDSRGCLNIDSDWDNELHPNSKGFEKLATGPWRAALEKYGFA